MKSFYQIVLRVVPRRHLIRLSYVFTKFSSVLYAGNKVECPVCGGRFRTFLPYGVHTRRNNVLCPRCLSLERHRLMWLYLKEKTPFFQQPHKVLHVAPEQCFRGRFSKYANLDYTTADLESPIADVKLDVQNMPFDDNTFDVVICNHVLEHVDNDRQAMREIYRVLKPGGFAVLHVPVDYSRPTTYEDASITTPAEREKHFWQKDHVRLYGRDYTQRLQEAGFVIDEPNFTDEIDENRRERYRLPHTELMYGYRKPNG